MGRRSAKTVARRNISAQTVPDTKAIAGQSVFGQGPAQVIGTATGTDLWNAPYQAAGLDKQDTVGWWPSRSSGDAITLSAKDLSLARIRDSMRNDPHAKAAVERLVDLIVGPRLSLASKPDGVALGIEDRKVLRGFAREIQSEWKLLTEDPRRTCDIQRKLSMNGLFRLFARTWMTCGEALYVLSWRDAPLNVTQRYSTCVMAIDPDRLSNPNGMYDTIFLRGGVEMDTFGAPVAYHIRNAHIGDYWAAEEAWTWSRVERQTSWGRPIVVHGYEPEREGQTRGISPFVALIRRLRMIGKFGDAELATATANAMFSAIVETDLPAEDVAARLAPSSPEFMDKVVKHFTENPAQVGGVRIPVFPPGSKVAMNSLPRQTNSFASFQTAFLQSIASALGLSYEQLAMDWSRTNYSSARAALNEVWRAIKRMSAVFVEQIVTPIFYAFVEEAFDKGYLKLPPGAKPKGFAASEANDNLAVFHALPGAILQCQWIGPARGIIDPLKEAQGSSLRLENMTSTFEKECAAAGDDWEDIIDQIAVEEDYLKARGLTRLSLVAAAQSGRWPKLDSVEADGPQGPGGAEKAASGQDDNDDNGDDKGKQAA